MKFLFDVHAVQEYVYYPDEQTLREADLRRGTIIMPVYEEMNVMYFTQYNTSHRLNQNIQRLTLSKLQLVHDARTLPSTTNLLIHLFDTPMWGDIDKIKYLGFVCSVRDVRCSL